MSRRWTWACAASIALMACQAAHPGPDGGWPSDAGGGPQLDSGCTGSLAAFFPPDGGMTPVGAALPTDQQAACMVAPHPGEQRPDNAPYKVAPAAAQLVAFVPDFVANCGGDSRVTSLAQRVTGAFTAGTTDEIIQWAAYKWGIDPQVLRAVGINETYWHQGLLYNGFPVEMDGWGDYTSTASACTSDYPLSRGYVVPNGNGTYGGPFYDQCPQSFGFVQWKWTSWPKTYPESLTSMSFNMDAWGARIRVWYEGYSYCGTSAQGDMWEAVAAHNTGSCLPGGGGIQYVTDAQTWMQTEPWNQPGF